MHVNCLFFYLKITEPFNSFHVIILIKWKRVYSSLISFSQNNIIFFYPKPTRVHEMKTRTAPWGMAYNQWPRMFWDQEIQSRFLDFTTSFREINFDLNWKVRKIHISFLLCKENCKYAFNREIKYLNRSRYCLYYWIFCNFTYLHHS